MADRTAVARDARHPFLLGSWLDTFVALLLIGGGMIKRVADGMLRKKDRCRKGWSHSRSPPIRRAENKSTGFFRKKPVSHWTAPAKPANASAKAGDQAS